MRIEDTRSQYLKNQGFYSSIIWILASIKLKSYSGFFICQSLDLLAEIIEFVELLNFLLSSPSLLR